MIFHLWMLYALLRLTSANPLQQPDVDMYWDSADSGSIDVSGTDWLHTSVHEQHQPSIVYPENFNRNSKQQMNEILFPRDSKEEVTTSGYWYVTGTNNFKHHPSGADIEGKGKHGISTETMGVINLVPKQNHIFGVHEATSQSPTFLGSQLHTSSSKDVIKIETTTGFFKQELVNGIEHYRQDNPNKLDSSATLYFEKQTPHIENKSPYGYSFLNHVKNIDIDTDIDRENVLGHSNRKVWSDMYPRLPNTFLVYIPERIIVPDMQPITQHNLYFNMSDYLPANHSEVPALDHKSFEKGMPAMVAYEPVGVLTSNGFLPSLPFPQVIPPRHFKPPKKAVTTSSSLDESDNLYVPGSRIISDLYRKHRGRRSTRSRISHSDLDEFIKEIDKVTSENRGHVDDLQSSRTPPKKQKTILGRIRDYLPSFGKKKQTRRSIQMDQHSLKHPKKHNSFKEKSLPKQKHHKAAKIESLNKVHNHRSLAPKNYNSHQTDKKQVRVVRSLSDNYIEENARNPLNNLLQFPSTSNQIPPSFQSYVLPNSFLNFDRKEWNPSISKVSDKQSPVRSSMEHYQYMNGNVPESQTHMYKEFGKVPNFMNSIQNEDILKLGKFVHLQASKSGKVSAHLYNDDGRDKYINELVDFIIYIINRGIMAKGNSTVNILDVDQEFEKSVLGIKIYGEFHGKNGWFKNLSSIYRDGDIVITRPAENTLTVQFSIALRTMEFGFDHYEASIAGIDADGQVNGVVSSNSMSLKVSVAIDSANKCNVSLDSFEVSKLGDIEFNITGFGGFKWFVNEITSWLSGHYKNVIINKVQQEIMTEINSALSHVKC